MKHYRMRLRDSLLYAVSAAARMKIYCLLTFYLTYFTLLRNGRLVAANFARQV